jgi:SAM-dependent methyltransferase
MAAGPEPVNGGPASAPSSRSRQAGTEILAWGTMTRVDPRPVAHGASHWAVYHRHWERLTPPLRVHPEVVDGYRAVVGEGAERVLLLGVTPELVNIGASLVAVDRNAAMVTTIWPGDTDRRRSVVGNWFDLPFRRGSFTAAMGDGGLNILEFPASQASIFAELARVLAPGAPVALRVFRQPERGETVASLRDEAFGARIAGFQAFKLRLAMAIVSAGSTPNVPVRRILEVFDRHFADRDALARSSGWSPDDIATIDLYERSADVYAFPTEREFASVVPGSFAPIRFVPVGTYELAERCPLLVTERRP